MEVIYLLFSISFLVSLGFLGCFLWASRQGQFEDLSTPAMRILFDDTQPESSTQEIKSDESREV